MIENTPAITFDNSIVSNLNKPNIMAKIKEINNNYLYWDKVKYIKVN